MISKYTLYRVQMTIRTFSLLYVRNRNRNRSGFCSQFWLISYPKRETEEDPRAAQTFNHERRMVSPSFRFPSIQTPSSDLYFRFSTLTSLFYFPFFFCFCWKFSYRVLKILKIGDPKSGLLAKIVVIFPFTLSLNF